MNSTSKNIHLNTQLWPENSCIVWIFWNIKNYNYFFVHLNESAFFSIGYNTSKTITEITNHHINCKLCFLFAINIKKDEVLLIPKTFPSSHSSFGFIFPSPAYPNRLFSFALGRLVLTTSLLHNYRGFMRKLSHKYASLLLCLLNLLLMYLKLAPSYKSDAMQIVGYKAKSRREIPEIPIAQLYSFIFTQSISERSVKCKTKLK